MNPTTFEETMTALREAFGGDERALMQFMLDYSRKCAAEGKPHLEGDLEERVEDWLHQYARLVGGAE